MRAARREGHETRPGSSLSRFGAFACLAAGGAALRRKLGRAGLPPGSHLDFDAIAAAGPSALPALIERGRELFKAKFTTADGAGRPKATQAIIPTKRKNGVNPPFSRTSGPDSNSCFGCHNDPIEGGAGDDVANVFVSEGFESAQFDTIDPSFSSERHTIALMGAGLVELLAREMTADLQAIRAAAIAEACATGKDARADLVTKGVRFGSIVAHPDGIVDLDAIDGVDADLIVRPFSRKGVFTSLRQFTINALNIHHGMEAVERFGVRWTGSHDFAESGVPDAITAGDVSALVAFQATLPPPTVKADLPDDWRQAASEGAKTFKDIGCASCHVETLPLKSLVFTDPAPYDMAGTLRSGEVKDADPHRSRRPALRQDAEEERQGRMADSRSTATSSAISSSTRRSTRSATNCRRSVSSSATCS